MRLFLSIFIFICAIALQSSVAQVTRSTTFDNREICEKDKAVWREFGNGCVDSCRAKFDRFSMCSAALTYACDCGRNRCWYDGRCVEIKDYKKAFDEQKMFEEERFKELKELRAEEFKANTNAILRNIKRSRANSTAKGKTDDKEVKRNSNLPSNKSPIVDLLGKEADKMTGNNVPVKQKFQIPAFFLKKQGRG